MYRIEVQYTEWTVNILKAVISILNTLIEQRILANTQKKMDDQKSKCIICNLFEHSPAIRTVFFLFDILISYPLFINIGY